MITALSDRGAVVVLVKTCKCGMSASEVTVGGCEGVEKGVEEEGEEAEQVETDEKYNW